MQRDKELLPERKESRKMFQITNTLRCTFIQNGHENRLSITKVVGSRDQVTALRAAECTVATS